MNKNPDDIEREKLIGTLYNALYLLVGMMVVFVIAWMIYLLVGNPFAGMFEAGPERKAPAPAPVATVEAEEEIVEGVHVLSGLKVGAGFEVVRAHCTACHSGKLVAQNRATREGWQEMIRWMQRTQGLWDLGKNEPIILDYLAEQYAPEEIGRRANLEEIEWYILEE